jgi:hypothetical protein
MNEMLGGFGSLKNYELFGFHKNWNPESDFGLDLEKIVFNSSFKFWFQFRIWKSELVLVWFQVTWYKTSG